MQIRGRSSRSGAFKASKTRSRDIIPQAVRLESLETRRMLADDLHHIDDGGINVFPGEAQVNNRWTTTANGATGATGNPATLTWGFLADGVSIPGGAVSGEPTANSSLQASLNALYGTSATWQPIFQSVMDRWSAVSGLTFNYTGLSDDGAGMPQVNVTGGASGLLGVRPDIRIGGHFIDGPSGTNVLAYCYFPNVGDMVIDTSNFNAGSFFANTANSSRALRNVIAHELGHGLGFNHVDPVNQTKLMEAFASTSFDGPQFDDIYAAQINYGDPFEKGGRNETAATASNLGTLVNGANAVSAWGSANNPTQARSIANTTDSDYLKFTITGSKNLTFNVSPFGPTYTQGAQGGATASFNAAAQGDLSITVYDTNGTTVLTTANATGLGGSETASLSNLPAGTYFLKVNIASGLTQPYNVSITAADAVVVPPPSTPDLTASSDTGTFANDNVTNDNTPTFVGTAQAGATVTLFAGASSVGTGVADASGNWSITPVAALADGTIAFSATATVGATTSVSSGTISVTIDTVAPAAPSGFRIRADNDTGPFSTDNVTNINAPIFTGTSEANSRVSILGNSTFVTVNGGVNFEGTLAGTFGNGGFTVNAITFDLAGNNSVLSTINIVVDTVKPTIQTSSFSRSPVQAIDFTFTENVFGALGSLALNNAALQSIPTVLGPTTANTARFFPSPANSLGDSTYGGTLLPGSATDLAGNTFQISIPSITFKFLRADFNGDFTVNFDDILTLAQNYGLPGQTHDQGDANYDGAVDFGDVLILAQTYNNSLAVGGSSQSPTASKRRNNEVRGTQDELI